MRVRLLLLPLPLLLLSPSGSLAGRPGPNAVRFDRGLKVSTRDVYYPIRGRTASDLRAQMDQYGPIDQSTGKRYDAFANWTLSWRYRDRISSGKCRFTSVKLVVELKYTYPRWLRPPGVPAPLARSWDRYLTALHRQENGHGAIAVQAGGKMLADIRALGPRDSCKKLQAAADLIAANGIARANRAEASYDAKSSRGGAHGARFL